jgi:hypothetical protein
MIHTAVPNRRGFLSGIAATALGLALPATARAFRRRAVPCAPVPAAAFTCDFDVANR